MKTDSEPLLHGVPEAARRLSLSETTVRDLVRRGDLDGRKSGMRLLVTAESIRKYASGLPRAGRGA